LNGELLPEWAKLQAVY